MPRENQKESAASYRSVVVCGIKHRPLRRIALSIASAFFGQLVIFGLSLWNSGNVTEIALGIDSSRDVRWSLLASFGVRIVNCYNATTTLRKSPMSPDDIPAEPEEEPMPAIAAQLLDSYVATKKQMRNFGVGLYGWPYHIASYKWFDSGGGRKIEQAFVFNHKMLGRAIRDNAIPVNVSWGNVLVNVLCFGLAIWIAMCCGRLVRMFTMLTSRRCIACGYELKELSTCPECGSTLAAIRKPV